VKPINLLYTIDNLLIGGAQELVKTLASNLNRERFKVSICSLIDYPEKSHNEPLTQEIEREGIEIFTLHMKSFGNYEEKRKFIDILKRSRIDIVHAHLRPTDLWTALMAKGTGIPVVIYTKHETYHNRSIAVRLKEAIVYNKYVDCAIAISNATRRHMITYELISPFKIKIIHNPVKVKKFTPIIGLREKVRRELGISLETPVIGNVARFVPRKGIEYFIKTCALVKKEIPNSQFLLVGWGEEEAKYRQMVKDMNLDDCFIFAVAKRNIPEFLSAMDIFLFTPIWGESLPIVMLEAMAAGKAIVTTNIISNPELIANGVSGLLPTPDRWAMSVNSLEVKALSDAVIKLIKNPQIRKNFGKAARKKVVDNFSIERVVPKLENLYIKLLIKKLGTRKAEERGLVWVLKR